MGRFLNVGIIQMPINRDTASNLKYISEKVDVFMSNYHKPELIVGVEGGIGYFTPQPIPGPISNFLAGIAKKHEIYFIPGTMYEVKGDLIYNSAPIFNPKGELIAVYRKMAPWRPSEDVTYPGKEYVVFDIPEKNTKIGVQICYDISFPEISRNEILMGAEVLVKLAMDPEELKAINKPVHFARAIENQAYLVSTNGVGFFGGSALYGNSSIINPEGALLWEGGSNETISSVTLDLELVRRSRGYGTLFLDRYLKHLKEYAFSMPYFENIPKAPLYQNLKEDPKKPSSIEQYEVQLKEIGVCEIGKLTEDVQDIEKYEQSLDVFLGV